MLANGRCDLTRRLKVSSPTPATALAILVSQIDYTSLSLTNAFQLVTTVLAIKVTYLKASKAGIYGCLSAIYLRVSCVYCWSSR